MVPVSMTLSDLAKYSLARSIAWSLRQLSFLYLGGVLQVYSATVTATETATKTFSKTIKTDSVVTAEYRRLSDS